MMKFEVSANNSPPWSRRGGRDINKKSRSLRIGADGEVWSSNHADGGISAYASAVVKRLHNRSEKKSKRQELRNAATTAEATLWKFLQRRLLYGRTFRRQHSIDPYIVDFYCPECRLVIELDGQPHYEIIADEYEVERSQYLERLGIKVVRFENRSIYESLEAVLETIRQELCPGGADGSAHA
jgi:very-short-patch-repair endonuclease